MWIQIVASCVLISVASAQINCSDKPDGIYGWGCRSFTRCEGGQGTVNNCEPPKVYNEVIGDCDNPENVDAPCGLRRDCTGFEDGRYADELLNCTSFYTCLGGLYYGHQPCNPGLVFDDRTGICNWDYMVPPPCGTCDGCPITKSKSKKTAGQKKLRRGFLNDFYLAHKNLKKNKY